MNPHHASRHCPVLFAGFGVRSDLIFKRAGRQPASCIIRPQKPLTRQHPGHGEGVAPSCLSLGSSPPPCLWGFRQPLFFPPQKHCRDARKADQLTPVAGNRVVLFCSVFRAKEVREGPCLENQADFPRDPLPLGYKEPSTTHCWGLYWSSLGPPERASVDARKREFDLHY